MMTKNLERSIFQSYKTIYIHACEKIKQVFDLEKAKAVGKKSSGRLSEAFGDKRQTERQKDRFFFPRSILTKLNFMKNFILTIVVSLASTVVMAMTMYSREQVESIEEPPSRPLALIENTPKIEAPKVELIVKNHSKFLEDIGMRESSGNYKAVNQFGYLGKYQFGRRTLNALGFDNVSNREFLENHSIQEEAMFALLTHNKKILRRQIQKYHGKTVHGIYITESGILAAAHLAGPGNVKKFFRKGYEFKDGNGTKMTSYMERFSNYKLEF